MMTLARQNPKSPAVDSYGKWSLRVALLCVLCASLVNSFSAVSITTTNYHGWPNSYVISNEAVEVIVVPAIGRVMQFRFAGEPDGPFFENRAMDGKSPIPTSKEWGNFGGDKTWPSPQEDWPKITPRGWPPPVAFDSMPVKASIEGAQLRLISAIDPHYGIRTERLITLHPTEPRMTIETVYTKVQGDPRKVGVWIITQLNEPDLVHIRTSIGDKYIRQSSDAPTDLKVRERSITLKRSASKSTKIGTDGNALLWVGPKTALRIESARVPGAEYPDKGSSAEVYTNPNPLTYVELEMLGPLHTLKPGDEISHSSAYTLFHRADIDAFLKEEVK